MTLDMVKELLSYNTWANSRLVDVVSRLDQNQFSRELPLGPGDADAHAMGGVAVA